MTTDEVLVAGALVAWRSALERADKFFTGLDGATLEGRVAPGRNRVVYIWGHLSAMHDRMLQLLGVADRMHPEFDGVFLSSPDGSIELPPVEVIRAWWIEISSKLNAGIVRLSTSDWLSKHAAVSAEDFAKDPLRNRFSILLTRTNHLMHHVGQLALVHK